MRTFRVMDTEVQVVAPLLDDAAEEALAHEVAAIFVAAERRFSRFRADSELSRLNRAIGPTPVSRDMIHALAAARRHVDASGGIFDPAIGAALDAAGYDRSFAGGLDRTTPLATPPPARFADVLVDEAVRVVVRPPHLRIDLGGILKGRTVDRAAARIPAPGFVGAGGDAVLKGAGPDGAGWLVDVEDPGDPSRAIVTLRVRDRAVATSAPNRRRWRVGGGVAHHLIDPRTMSPAASDLEQATAVADTAEDADVLAKVAFLLGAEAGARHLERRGAAGVLVGRDGVVHLVGDLEVDHA